MKALKYTASLALALMGLGFWVFVIFVLFTGSSTGSIKLWEAFLSSLLLMGYIIAGAWYIWMSYKIRCK